MQAQALITREDQSFELAPLALPDPGPDEVLVRALLSGVSVGTEFRLIRGSLSWGPYPLCTGYQAVGTVERAGADVAGLAEGDLVYYRGGVGGTLDDGTPVSAVSGAHASRAVVKPEKRGIALLPQTAPLEAASLFVMPSVGYHGVDLAAPALGQTAVVNGCGLIGLGVVAALVNRGTRVIAVDIAPRALQAAKRLGADHAVNAADQDADEAVRRLAPDGADVVFEATGIPAMLDRTVVWCRRFGTFVWQGNYGAEPVSIHFLLPHGRQVRAVFPCDDGGPPCRAAVVKHMATGRLPWADLITHRLAPADAPAFYAALLDGSQTDHLAVVIDWRQTS
jgi:L-iditol 2-dehydrogenase